MAISSYTTTGAKSTNTTTLRKEIFEVEITNHELLKEAYITHKANGRINLAKTLKRGEVSGGGKKPWRQKGTGNARTGSIRNPIWRGGGIVFGPSGNENYKRKINAKARQNALKQALTLAVMAKKLSIIEDLNISSGKTKDAAALLTKINASPATIIVVKNIDATTVKAYQNISTVRIVFVRDLSVVDVLDARTIILTKEALETLNQRLGGAK